ncbi:MAG TPA: hypothetical protein VGK72_08360, partial [Chthoniobacterales bacterium]
DCKALKPDPPVTGKPGAFSGAPKSPALFQLPRHYKHAGSDHDEENDPHPWGDIDKDLPSGGLNIQRDH